MHAHYAKRSRDRRIAATGIPGAQQLDRRPAAVAQRRLQQAADSSPQVRQLRAVLGPAVVQRQIEDLAETLPEVLRNLALEYNVLAVETPLDQRIAELSKVEHAVYRWLIANKQPDMNELAGAQDVRRMMDTTKAERQRIVAQSIKAQDHAGDGAIPIAGMEKLLSLQQQEVRTLWRSLVEGSGAISIDELGRHGQHEGFRLQVLTEFSRLLEGQFGREMVKDIDTSGHKVVIQPFHLMNDDGDTFKAVATEQGAQKLQRLAEQPPREQEQQYPEHILTDMDETGRRQLFNNLKPEPGQLGVKLSTANDSVYYRFGAGSGATIYMPSDLQDSSQHMAARLADDQGNELASPVFITLGHELGHVLHGQRGAQTGAGFQAPGFFQERTNDEAYHGDAEEYINIEENENALRTEHGLNQRKGHYNIPLRQSQAIQNTLESLRAKVPADRKDLTDRINTLQEDAYKFFENPQRLALMLKDFTVLKQDIARAATPEKKGNCVMMCQRMASSVVQREIVGIDKSLPRDIREIADNYNNLSDEIPLGERMAALSAVEHEAYAWLTANKAPDLGEVDGSPAVRQLMDSAKDERLKIVERSVEKPEQGQIPVAGFEQLEQEEQQQIGAIWQGLVSGQGKIKIIDTDHETQNKYPGFSLQILTEFSRLLEGKYGRTLVKELSESDHRVVIEPFTLRSDSKRSLAAGLLNPDDAENNSLERLPRLPEEAQAAEYPEVDITQLDAAQRVALFNELKPQPGQLGVILVDNGVPAYYKFGKGADVRVMVPTNLNDKSDLKESRMADPAGNELATPVFIALGHELGHGRHMQRGTVTRGVDLAGIFKAQGDRNDYAGNAEEYINIQGTENALRTEHGLGQRRGHYSIPYLQYQQMLEQCNTWIDWAETADELLKLPMYQQILQSLCATEYTLKTGWADPPQLANLRRTFKALPNNIRDQQQQYLQQNFVTHLHAEEKQLIVALLQPEFSFKPNSDIAAILMGLSVQFKHERLRAGIAARTQGFPQYLSGLAAERTSVYSSFEPKVLSIGEAAAEAGTNQDRQKFKKLTTLLSGYNKAAWLFPG
jgi:hypothetical protein